MVLPDGLRRRSVYNRHRGQQVAIVETVNRKVYAARLCIGTTRFAVWEELAELLRLQLEAEASEPEVVKPVDQPAESEIEEPAESVTDAYVVNDQASPPGEYDHPHGQQQAKKVDRAAIWVHPELIERYIIVPKGFFAADLRLGRVARSFKASSEATCKIFVLTVIYYKWGAPHPYPSVARIAKEMNASERTVKRCIKTLTAAGLLEVVARPKRPSVYDFTKLFDYLKREAIWTLVNR